MADYDMSKSTTTDLDSNLDNFEVSPQTLDRGENDGENEFEFPEATTQIGYYKEIPEFKKAVDALATWTVGRGYEVEDPGSEDVIDHLSGRGGEDFVSIMWNMLVMKKIIGDSFAEIVRVGDEGKIANLKPISAERMKIVQDGKGIIKRYEVRGTNGKWTKKEPEDILHLCNERVGDEGRGVSSLEAWQQVRRVQD